MPDQQAERGDAVAVIADEILRAGNVLRIKLDGLRLADPDRAELVARRIVEMIAAEPRSGAAPRREVHAVAEAPEGTPGDLDIEDFILATLGDSPAGISVEHIYSNVEEAGYDIKRPTLVVRLHRMAAVGKLISPARGHYRLPDADLQRGRVTRLGVRT